MQTKAITTAHQTTVLVLLVAFFLLFGPFINVYANECVVCHVSSVAHLNKQHQFAQQTCVACHHGDESASSESVAHKGLITSPGNLSNAEQICAICHPKHVRGVTKGPMHTGKHIVRTTREILQPDFQHQSGSFQQLGHGLADSMLRKQCASCHLGHERKRQQPDAVTDRGGGCLACHLNALPGNLHPILTRKVEDARCFGCHSRSGRISMSYAGLAEVDTIAAAYEPVSLAKLPDGRLVQRMNPDIHHQAGMACIDCHTGSGLMNLNTGKTTNRVDISCSDCHANNNARLTIDNWPQQHQSMLKHIPFEASNNQGFLQTSSGTPLIHIDTSKDTLLLYPKLGGTPKPIPTAKHTHLPRFNEHEKLSCDSCHAQWIPTCLGCHMHYDEEGKQWDYAEQQFTPGVWHEQRWNTGSGPTTLGKTDENSVDVFLPGMIMTLDHPDLDNSRFIRRFAPISPHTTGSARTCAACHHSSTTLGLGKGKLQDTKGQIRFDPEMEKLVDGLPADAWTDLHQQNFNESSYPRPFTNHEIEQIYRALPH